MKIQFAIHNPDIVQGNDLTIMCGVATSTILLDDFSVMPFMFNGEQPELEVSRQFSLENLVERDRYGYNLPETAFHQILTQNVWKRVSVDARHPAGEVCFVKTNLPETPEGMHSYAIFGIIQGNTDHLKAHCERIQEATFNMARPDQLQTVKAQDTQQAAHHKIGTNLLNILATPIWGFGEKKYAMSSGLSISGCETIAANTQYIIEHGKNHQDYRGMKPDPEYVSYLRAMHKRGLVPMPQWLDEESLKSRSKAARRCLIESQENSMNI